MLSVIVSSEVEHHGVGCDALTEVVEVFASGRCPSRFGDGHEARQCQIFHQYPIGHVLGPESSLHTGVVCLLCGGNSRGGHRHFVVSGLQIVGAGSCQRSFAFVHTLSAVDVIRSPGGVNVVESELGSTLCTIGGWVAPGPYIHVRFFHQLCIGTAGRDGLVPDAGATTVLLKEIGHFLDEMRLKLSVRCQPQFLITCLAHGIALPSAGGTLIATDVNVLTREDVEQFGPNILHKLHGCRVGHVENVARDTTARPHFPAGRRAAAEFGISHQRSNKVTRHVEFGNHFDVACLGVCHHLTQLILSVEERTILCVCPIGTIFQRCGIAVVSCRPHGGEFRILLYLHAPALVVAEVPMEIIHLIGRHDVNHTLDFIDGEEVACHVEHKSAIGKARFVVDGYARQRVFLNLGICHAGHHIAGQHLLDGLESIEEAACRGCLNTHILAHSERIALRGCFFQTHCDERIARSHHCGLIAGGSIEVGHEAFGLSSQTIGQAGIAHRKCTGQHQFARADGHLLGFRCQVHEGLRHGRAQAKHS